MAKKGDVLTVPWLGERVVVLESAQDTGGNSLRLELHLMPGSSSRLEHIHPAQKELIAVMSPSVSVRVAGAERKMKAGQKLEILPSSRHMYWNSGDAEAVVQVEYRPALRMEEFLDTLHALEQVGQVSPKTGLPASLLQRAALLHTYRPEMRLAPAVGLTQSVLFAVLAAVARVLGQHPTPRRST